MLYFWLGIKAEEIIADWDASFNRAEVIDCQADCKPEADGFITVHPKVR